MATSESSMYGRLLPRCIYSNTDLTIFYFNEQRGLKAHLLHFPEMHPTSLIDAIDGCRLNPNSPQVQSTRPGMDKIAVLPKQQRIPSSSFQHKYAMLPQLATSRKWSCLSSLKCSVPKMAFIPDIDYNLASQLEKFDIESDIEDAIPLQPKKKLGFLDLPPETRLQIYDILLLNRSPDGDLYAVNMVDSRKRRKTSYEPFAIYSSGEKSGRTPAKGPINSCDYTHASILRTCKQIANEGSNVLYSKNVFAIDLSREAIVPLNSYPFKRRTRAIIRHISKHTKHDGEGYIVLPQYVNELASHAFLSQIGEQNATTIKHIEIFAQHTDEYKIAMPIITAILKQQIPRLRTATFHMVAHGGDHRSYLRDEYENAIETRRIVPTGHLWPFDPNNPHIGTGSWPETRDAIKNFIHEMPSLEVLKYEGCWTFACLPPLPYITPIPSRIYFEGNDFDGYHWRLAMEESDVLEKEVRTNYVERRKEMNMAARETVCPEVVNLRRIKRARLAEEGGVRKSVLRFFDGIFWVDS